MSDTAMSEKDELGNDVYDSDPEDVTEARSGNAEAWAKLDFEPFRLRKYESDFRLFYWFGPKVTPELWRQSDFGHRWSLSATLIFIFAIYAPGSFDVTWWLSDMDLSAAPVFAVFTAYHSFGETNHQALAGFFGTILGTVYPHLIWSMFSYQSDDYIYIVFTFMFIFNFLVFASPAHMTFKQYACGMGNWYMMTMVNPNSTTFDPAVEDSFWPAWKCSIYGCSGMLFAMAMMGVPFPRSPLSYHNMKRHCKTTVIEANKAFCCFFDAEVSGTFMKSQNKGFGSHQFAQGLDALKNAEASLAAMKSEIPRMWWEGASTTGKDTVNAKALAETLETMLWSLTTMSKVMMNIKSEATSKMIKQMIDSDNQFATIGELEEIMRQIRIELENWDEDVIDLKKIKKIRKTDITEKAKHVADLFAYHLFEWRTVVLYNKKKEAFSDQVYNADKNMNQYLFVDSVKGFYDSLANLSTTVDNHQDAAEATHASLYMGLFPSQPFADCTLNQKTIAVGFKLALTVLLVAVVSATELTATSGRYSATGLSFVVYVMGGNDIGTSFTKSYNRMLGLVCGVCLPTMVEDWIGCESNVLTILFVYFYVWGCGTVYAGAIPQFQYAGLVCGYVTIVEMSYQNCDSATTLDSLNASFIAMVFLIVVEMNVMHTSAKTEFTESMSKFWNAFGADERGLVNNIFYLYIAKHDITVPDQKISNTATRATIAAGINDCLTYLAEARVFLHLVEQEPQFSSPLPPGYRAYLDGADSLMGAIRGIDTTMSRILKDAYKAEDHAYSEDNQEISEGYKKAYESMEILDGMSEEEKNKFLETTHISYNLPGSEEEGQVVNPMLISNSDVLDLYSTVRNQLQNFSICQLDVLERTSLKKNTSKPFKSRRSDWMIIPDKLSAAINQAKGRVDHLLKSAVKTEKPVYPNQKIIGHHSLQRNLQETSAAVQAMHTSLLGMQNYPLSRVNGMLTTDKKKDGDASANPEGADQEGTDQEDRSDL